MSHFFAHMARMKLIQRWPLMRNIERENVAEHSQQVAMVTHLLALIKNTLYGGKVNPAEAALLALYHDASEVITGDMPTPVKYFNPDIAKEYKKIECFAEQKLLHMLPPPLRAGYIPLLDSEHMDEEYKSLVKDADTLCAYIKCLEELSAGNHEFTLAKRRLESSIEKRKTPEMNYFITHFLPSFELTLDEISEDDTDL
ncbi:5'-deoxynucleotidase [Motilimonas eburnea]|uniref:5'-deoxynucleotidase n=1 Tax=Motilimonas eburnea TaxID=1737488 RepID=UPI001E6078C6|nr:5'-deoxynucleotidase [Motilimonas eburnea]MCE2570145.1 5'-deoxynucleotidase [Motilimonas eburnea]